MSNPWKDTAELRKKLAEAGEGQRTKEHEKEALRKEKAREEASLELAEQKERLVGLGKKIHKESFGLISGFVAILSLLQGFVSSLGLKRPMPKDSDWLTVGYVSDQFKVAGIDHTGETLHKSPNAIIEHQIFHLIKQMFKDAIFKGKTIRFATYKEHSFYIRFEYNDAKKYKVVDNHGNIFFSQENFDTLNNRLYVGEELVTWFLEGCFVDYKRHY
jgi:hypothetical protein